MQIQAYFENIQSYVIQELDNATYSIVVSTPVLTDPEIFELLCRKAQENIRVEILLSNDRANTKSGLDYEDLQNHGATVVFAGDNRNKTQLYNKFCVIDAEIVLAGTYDWTPPDQEQNENITIAKEASDIASQFIIEFRAMLQRGKHKSNECTIDHAKLVARLEALRGMIHADDDDDIAQQLFKLKKLIANKDEITEVQEIIALLDQDRLEDAEIQIVSFLNASKQVSVYVDPELTEVKLELKSLEIQISALENEKHEIDRTLHAYKYRHTIELGELIRQILFLNNKILRKEAEQNPEKEAEFEESQREYEEFEADFNKSSENEVAFLSPEKLQEIKKLFRDCTKLCHPDVVADEYKDEATSTFNKLAEAYDCNDIETVKEVYQNLQKGIFAATSDTLNDVQRMHRSLITMRATLTSLSKQISSLINSDTYRVIAAISDWDEYFATLKEQMQDELERLREFDDEN